MQFQAFICGKIAPCMPMYLYQIQIRLAITFHIQMDISYTDGSKTTENTVYKLLNTDYNNYALVCGFTNATNTSMSFGIILTRERYPNLTQVIDLEDSASLLYSDFEFGTMPLVTQSPKCYTAGVTPQYSVFSTIVAFLYSTLVQIVM
ncbi:uncharacterized protein LOC119615051 [Lucilia sericata]|uniref:uncharacterized protein LOC119615051 n=1 Tax=Lucilia sericata TaxID=13632 RepID=UPI0018A82DA0|nr:uncharacterized protein LOC119615051 [Lucilia sericata]